MSLSASTSQRAAPPISCPRVAHVLCFTREQGALCIPACAMKDRAAAHRAAVSAVVRAPRPRSRSLEYQAKSRTFTDDRREPSSIHLDFFRARLAKVERALCLSQIQISREHDWQLSREYRHKSSQRADTSSDQSETSEPVSGAVRDRYSHPQLKFPKRSTFKSATDAGHFQASAGEREQSHVANDLRRFFIRER